MNGFLVEIPVIVKSRTSDDGRRLVAVEASSEAVDSEGDVILQKALMDSGPTFIKSGNLDIDHLSELGDRLGIPDPMSYIVGRPTEVRDLGKNRTEVEGEIRKASDGKHNPKLNRYDAFWDTLQSDPPVAWRASIFGFPKSGMVDDCRDMACDGGATRFLVKGIDWRSLAFTRNPVNTDLKGTAHIVTAKSFVAHFAKNGASASMPAPISLGEFQTMPYNLDGMVGQHKRHISKDCPFTGGLDSTLGFKQHFMGCCGAGPDQADIAAHALMHHLLLERKRTAA